MGVSKSVPIEALAMYFLVAATAYEKHPTDLYVADFFLRFKYTEGDPTAEKTIDSSIAGLEETFALLNAVYDLDISFNRMSSFRATTEYENSVAVIQERVKENMLDGSVSRLIPAKRRRHHRSKEHIINQLACIHYLREEENYLGKFSSPTESGVDLLAKTCGVHIGCMYLRDAYALDTPAIISVPHGSPVSNATSNGRIVLGEDRFSASSKIMDSNRYALHSIATIACVAAEFLGEDHPTPEELYRLDDIRLAKRACGLVTDNIIVPYREVMHNV